MLADLKDAGFADVKACIFRPASKTGAWVCQKYGNTALTAAFRLSALPQHCLHRHRRIRSVDFGQPMGCFLTGPFFLLRDSCYIIDDYL
jgi:hypothetical protein